jgi:formate hydrogenlyase subunit 3/multisubunit Na+/H+ antiporter MnhD subunit
MQLHADPLSILFLLILAPQLLAALASQFRSPSFYAFAAGMVLTLLADSPFTLIFGFELMSAASWLLVLRGDRAPAPLYAGIALFSAACLIPALFLPPGSLAFTLILLATAAKSGLAPLHVWLPRAHPAPPAAISALMSGGMVKISLYILIRYAFIAFNGFEAPWWGAILIALGAASVLIGSLRAFLEVEMKTMLAWSTIEHVGLIATGIGVALRAKAMQDPALAALALQAALLCAIAHGLFKPMLFLGAGAIKSATGTTSLDWLGGLMRGMPKLGALMLLAAAGMAALPLGPGFAPEFLLLHAVIAAAATGGILARIGFIALLAALGLAAALALGAAVRFIGIGFLGRPRTLHAAAAEDAPPRTLAAIALLGALCIAVSLFPGLILAALTPVIRQLCPAATPAPLAYAPLTLVCLLVLATAIAVLLLRQFAPRGTTETPAWNGGFGAPPIWLPFGDPLTQPSATGFAEPLRRALGPGPSDTLLLAPLLRANLALTRLAEKIRRATVRERLAFVFAALVLSLLTLGLVQGG